MAKNYLVKIGTKYLTSTGLIGGIRCKSVVSGFDQLVLTKTGSVEISADGSPVVQIVDAGRKGITVEVAPVMLTKDVYDQIITEVQAAIDGGTTMALEISGDTGSFTGVAVPALPRAISFGNFRNSRIFGFTVRLITA